MSPKLPDVKITLTDGNIFGEIGRVSEAMRKAGHGDKVAEFQDYVHQASSWEDAICRITDWVSV